MIFRWRFLRVFSNPKRSLRDTTPIDIPRTKVFLPCKLTFSRDWQFSVYARKHGLQFSVAYRPRSSERGAIIQLAQKFGMLRTKAQWTERFLWSGNVQRPGMFVFCRQGWHSCIESREMVDLFGENWSGAVIRYFVDAFISCKVKFLIKKKKKKRIFIEVTARRNQVQAT